MQAATGALDLTDETTRLHGLLKHDDVGMAVAHA
jgi:hypothetical protein